MKKAKASIQSRPLDVAGSEYETRGYFSPSSNEAAPSHTCTSTCASLMLCTQTPTLLSLAPLPPYQSARQPFYKKEKNTHLSAHLFITSAYHLSVSVNTSCLLPSTKIELTRCCRCSPHNVFVQGDLKAKMSQKE